MPATGSSARLPSSEVLSLVAAAALLSAAFLWFCLHRGYTLYSGDAAAHLNTARRVVDSRTPGWEQLGTVWLPLPHLLMVPLVRYDALWRSGLAGALLAACFFVAGAGFLYAAVRAATASRAAALASAAAFGLNPNLLYLQSTPMTEPIFFGCLAAAVFLCARFHAAGRLRHALAAGLAVLAASLTRYEGWFLIPFVALFFLLAGSWRPAILFLAVASLGPLYWLAHNQYFYSDALEFYRGPYSPMAIQAGGLARGYAPPPGDHDLATAWLYYRRAMELALGRPLVWLAPAGALMALRRPAWRPLLLLAVPVPFYLFNIYSGNSPLYIPALRPYSYYNTRYALAALPACAAALGLLVALAPSKLRAALAAALLLVSLGGWLRRPSVESWICWKESEVNSRGRRAWTRQAAEFFQRAYRPGDGILTASGDVLAVYQAAGIPLRETVNDGSRLEFFPAVNRPDLFLRQRWVVAIPNDGKLASVAEKVAEFRQPREPLIEIYRKRP